MGPEEEAYLNSLIAKRKATTGDGPRVVTVPNFENLTREQQLWVGRKVDQLDQEVPLNTDALMFKLERLQEDDDSESDHSSIGCKSYTQPWSNPATARPLETAARSKLEEIGCPPCYPPNLDYPVEEPFPEKFHGAMAWFKQEASTSELLLCTQLRRWEEAHRCSRSSHGLHGKSHGYFIRSVVARRKHYGVFHPEDPSLRYHPRNQNVLQNWIEYQDYMFRELEAFEHKIKATLRMFGPDHMFYQGDLERLEMHKGFLDWIEQQRPYLDQRARIKEQPQADSTEQQMDQEPTIYPESFVSKLTNKKRKYNDPTRSGHAQKTWLSTSLELSDALSLEADARQRLESKGCPPCYPLGLQFPLSKPYPKAHESAIAWFDLVGTPHNGLLLCHQAYHWREAILHSRFVHGLEDQSHGTFSRGAIARRKKYGVFREQDPLLSFSPRDQSPLQNWLEYQDYMFREMEALEKNIEESLDQPELGDVSHKEKLHRLKILKSFLGWIEQQRPYFQKKLEDIGQPESPLMTGRELQRELQAYDYASTAAKPNFPSSKPQTAIDTSKKPPKKEPARLDAGIKKRQSPRRSSRKHKPKLAKQPSAKIPKKPKKSEKRRPLDIPTSAPGETKTRYGRISRKPQRLTP